MSTVSRRGLFALGGSGAAAAVLASCGGSADVRADSDDAALLGAALEAETGLGDAYASAGGIEAGFATASRRRAAELDRLIEQAGGSPADDQGGAQSGATDEAAEATIGAYRQGAGRLTTAELRGTTIGFLAEVAAELAAVRGQAGEDEVPRAFVTGLPEEPREAGGGDATTADTGEGG